MLFRSWGEAGAGDAHGGPRRTFTRGHGDDGRRGGDGGRAGLAGRTIGLTVRYSDFVTITRHHTFTLPTDTPRQLWQAVRDLKDKVSWAWEKKDRQARRTHRTTATKSLKTRV